MFLNHLGYLRSGSTSRVVLLVVLFFLFPTGIAWTVPPARFTPSVDDGSGTFTLLVAPTAGYDNVSGVVVLSVEIEMIRLYKSVLLVEVVVWEIPPDRLLAPVALLFSTAVFLVGDVAMNPESTMLSDWMRFRQQTSTVVEVSVRLIDGIHRSGD